MWLPSGINILLAGLAALLLAGCGSRSSHTPAALDVTELTIVAPTTIPAGAALSLRIETIPPVTAPVLVTLDGSAGFVPFTLPLQAGEAVLELENEITRFAGVLSVNAQVDDVRATADIEIAPGAPVDPVQPLVGPRSIVAGGQDRTMIVAIPLDARGNPVADDTPVTIYARHPLSSTAASVGNVGAGNVATRRSAPGVEVSTTATQHLLAWARVASGTQAGDMLLAAQSESAYSPERTVRVVPDVPNNITVRAFPDGLAADGRQLATLFTEPITDRFGNPMLDGMYVEFLITDEAGRRQRIPAVTIDGRARATLQAPTLPGTLTIRAVMAGATSAPATLTFVAGPAVADFPVDVVFGPDDISLVAGPLVGALNQFVPDGTDVLFTVQGVQSTPRTLAAVAQGGYATATLRTATLDPGVYDVTATVGTGQGRVTFQVR